MKTHLKLAYDHGVNVALSELGIDKEAFLGLKMNLAARLASDPTSASSVQHAQQYGNQFYRNAKAGKAVGLGATAATYPASQEKQAFITTEKDRQEARSQGLLYGGTAELAAVPLLGVPAGVLFNKSLVDEGTTPEQAQKLINAMGLQKQYGSDGSLQRNSRVDLGGDPHEGILSRIKGNTEPGARYNHNTGDVHLNRKLRQASPDILAHELGHATMQKKNLLSKLRRASLKSFYQFSPLFSLATMGATHYTDPESDNPYLILAVGAAAQAPKVLEEGLASVKAMKALRQTGDYSEAVLKQMRRRLGKAGLTYLAAGLGAAAAPFAMRYGQRAKLDE